MFGICEKGYTEMNSLLERICAEKSTKRGMYVWR